MSTAVAHTTFELRAESEAGTSPERRGLARDGVRLLVAGAGGVRHRRFRDIVDLLEPGDLLVVNTSATLAAALDATDRYGVTSPLHFSASLDDSSWVVEIRLPDNSGPDLTRGAGAVFALPGGVGIRLLDSWPDPAAGSGRLWRAATEPATAAPVYLARFGRPIRYRYASKAVPLSAYQNVYATHPGSAEMPSAGRPFTSELLVALMARGIVVAPLVLHCGVSSPEAHELPGAEPFDVPESTARLVRTTREAGGRIVAVGTTVVRALESATDADGVTRAAAGWTDLVLGPGRRPRVVSGLITGLHAPEASHLLLLEAVAGPDLVSAAYATAVAGGYLWHEFGDSTLFLP